MFEVEVVFVFVIIEQVEVFYVEMFVMMVEVIVNVKIGVESVGVVEL